MQPDPILNFVRQELLNEPNSDITSEDDLLETGLVDSIGMMRLVAFIEAERGSKIPANDLVLENFRSIDAIVQYLAANPITP